MVLVNGLIQTKQPTKDIGLARKKMDKEPKFGPMDIFIKANLKIVSGADKEF